MLLRLDSQQSGPQNVAEQGPYLDMVPEAWTHSLSTATGYASITGKVEAHCSGRVPTAFW